MVDARKVKHDKVQNRRITESDYKIIEEMVNAEIDLRKKDPFRTDAERIWREIDRQIAMKPLVPLTEQGSDPDNDWHNAVEIGDQSRASEIITADIMRLIFPNDRAWFEVHGDYSDKEFPRSDDPAKSLARFQKKADNRQRSYMAQQHNDFGFKQRFKLSVKESLHHGGMVAEIANESMTLIHKGGGIEHVIAPTWKPYSMWDVYPDPSAMILPTNLFYTGSMLLRSWQKLDVLKRRTDLIRLNKVKKKKNKRLSGGDEQATTNDVEIFKWLGPISIPRKTTKNIFIPNAVVIIANGTLVKMEIPDTPYPNVIYSGYERQDVLNPYFTSPLMKSSTWQIFNSRSMNKFLDAVDLKTEPPLTYNVNSPEAAKDGGPEIAPRAMTPVSVASDINVLDVGDPQSALAGLRIGIDQMQQNLGADENRAGVAADVEQTATEVRNANQRAEVRTVDFVGDLEDGPLTSYLYIQNYFNQHKGINYPFYNAEVGQPDFEMFLPKKDIPSKVHFDIIGSKGILGEERRQAGMIEVTNLLLNNEKTADIPDVFEIAKIAYQDVGVKRPETVLNLKTDEEKDQVDARVKELEQEIIALEEAAEQTREELEKELEAANEKAAELTQQLNEMTLDKKEADVREQEQRLVAQELRNKIGSLKDEMNVMRQQMALKEQTIKSIEEIRKEKKPDAATNGSKGDNTPLDSS